MKTAPIAIIGIGCRLPGGSNSPKQLWKNLCQGMNAVRVLPRERFNIESLYHPKVGQNGKTYSKWGALVDRFDRFDPGFFNISPREADFVDPQQRMLLESSWRALEDAGQRIDMKRGSNIGVFAGISTTDYHVMQSQIDSHDRGDIFSATGSIHSIAANRVSYVFNFRGPSVAVDTACSSSQIAVHQACQSLRNEDCEMALAGGVNAILGPAAYLIFSKMNMLSPRGRCHAFDSRADGFVRGEGAGMLLLKPLERARKDGDFIYATILATGANQDGKTNGITVPSPFAQEILTRETCERAGVDPKDVDYAEAHGTGTPVGDPIEAHALGRALGEGRSPEKPCWVGSVKTNIGHLESGAGVAGLIKAALCLQNRIIPPNLHFRKPNPNINFNELKLKVVDHTQALPESGPLTAVINSFGFGGANANAVIQSPPVSRIAGNAVRRPTAPSRTKQSRGLILTLSGNSMDNFPLLARNVREAIEKNDSASPADWCQAAFTRQSRFLNCIALPADSREDLIQKLKTVERGEVAEDQIEGSLAEAGRPAPVWVFSGQGPQWYAMGRELLKNEPVFRAVIERCDEIMSELGDWSLVKELKRAEKSSRIGETQIAQPAIFALQAGLADLWKDWGLQPSAVVGHSVGEVAAAYCAGVLSLEDAARVIYLRGAAMEATPLRGKMLAASLTESEARKCIKRYVGRVHIGAVNSPNSVTLSGDGDAIEDLAASLEKKKIFARLLRVNYAFHSHHMDPARQEFNRRIGKIQTRKPTIPIYSTVTGELADKRSFSVNYWWDNIRQPVYFARAIETMVKDEFRDFLEISPHPVLSSSIQECLNHRGAAGTTISTLERKQSEAKGLMKAVGHLYALGLDLDWQRVTGGDASRADWPEAHWNLKPHWHESKEHYHYRVVGPEHGFLHDRKNVALPTWTSELNTETSRGIKDHKVQEATVFPASGYVETALEAGALLHGDKPVVVEDLALNKALFLAEGATYRYQFELDPETSRFQISSLNLDDPEEWSLHGKGKMRLDRDRRPPGRIDIEEWKQEALFSYPGKPVYEAQFAYGFFYGPDYQGMQTIYRHESRALADIEMPRSVEKEFKHFIIHPALLDQLFQLSTFALPLSKAGKITEGFMPVRCGRVRLFQCPQGRHFHATSQMVHWGGKTLRCLLSLLDQEGNVLLEVEDFETQSVLKTGHSRALRSDGWLYHNQWKPLPKDEDSSVAPEPGPAPEVTTVPLSTERIERREFSRQANEVAAAYLKKYFEQKKLIGPDGSVTRQRLEARKGISKNIIHNEMALLDCAAEEIRSVKKTQKGWAFSTEARDPDALWEKGLMKFPRAYPEWIFLRRAAERLPEWMAGNADSTDIWRPRGDRNLLEQFEQDSLTLQQSNVTAAGAIVSHLRHMLGDGGPVAQVAHLHAGTGGLAASILPLIGKGSCSYTLTDGDAENVILCEKKFFDYHFLKCLELAPGRRLNSKSLKPNSQDAVILEVNPYGNIQPELTARWVKRLLKPGGCLIAYLRPEPPFWMRLCSTSPSLSAQFKKEEWTEAFGATLESQVQNGLQPADLADDGTIQVFLRPTRKEIDTKQLSLVDLQYTPPATYLLFEDRSGVAPTLRKLFEEDGQRVVRVTSGRQFSQKSESHFIINPCEPGDMRRLLKNLTYSTRTERLCIVYAWPLDLPASLSSSSINQYARKMLTPLVNLNRSLDFQGPEAPRSVHVITRGGQAVEDGAAGMSPPSAIFPGFMRAWMAETPRLPVRLLDLAPDPLESELLDLADEILDPDDNPEVAFRSDGRKVLRLNKARMARHSCDQSDTVGYRLEVVSPGTMDSLTFIETPRLAPGRGQVEVEVKSAALNFRDVLKTLDIYPSDSELDRFIGDECSGVITRVGPGVTGWKTGDAVVAMAAGCFSSHLTVPAEMLFSKPEALTFPEAVTLPVAFMTAHYALVHLGQIRKGETVLIQAGTGGVGLAAIQVARQAGARVFASAGDFSKREMLRFLGADAVFDSRSIDFQEGVMQATDGRGVDLVLNSLAGHAIEKGLECLAPFGRFLEIGKRDIYANTSIGLRPLRNNISMHVIDLGVLMQERDERFVRIFDELNRHFQSGAYRPILHRVFPMSHAQEAFRSMAQAKHMGKIVLNRSGEAIIPESRPKADFSMISSDGAYLITGGMTGFGLQTAKWLCAQKAGVVYLVGRKKRESAELKLIMDFAGRHGIKIKLLTADVSRKKDVNRLFAELSEDRLPLRGIFHSAMVLDDGLLRNMDQEQLERVLGPKVAGCWNLHEASLKHPLDLFVMYSSVSSMIGNAGQANYAAANSFLDGMSHFRRSQGLPATTVNWGQLGQTGVAAENDFIAQNLAKMGLTPLPIESAFKHLERLLTNDHTQTGVMPIDWGQLFSHDPKAKNSPRFSDLAEGITTGASTASGSLKEALFQEPPSKRKAKMISMLQEEIGAVLRSPSSKITPSRPLSQLGLDSLMTFELILKLESAFEVSLPPGRLKAGSSVDELANFLLELLGSPVESKTDDSGSGEEPSVKKSGDTDGAAVQRPLPPQCLVVIRDYPSKPALFAIHTPGGLASIYVPLADHLPLDIPFTILQSRAFFTDEGEYPTLKSMTDAYADAIIKKAEGRPIQLLGYSNGGYLARQVARNIEDAGRHLDWLGLVDCLDNANDPRPETEESISFRLEEMLRAWEDRLGWRLFEPSKFDLSIKKMAEEMVHLPPDSSRHKVGIRWFRKQGTLKSDLSNRLIEQYLTLWEHHYQLIKFNQFPAIGADVHHWVSSTSDRHPDPEKRRNGPHITTGIYQETIIGHSHFNMMRSPEVQEVADSLADVIHCRARIIKKKA